MKIDWPEIWKKFDCWFDKTEDPVREWSSQKRAIERLVNEEIKPGFHNVEKFYDEKYDEKKGKKNGIQTE